MQISYMSTQHRWRSVVTAEVLEFPRHIYRAVMRDVTYTTYCFPSTSPEQAEAYVYALHRGQLEIDDRDYELLVSDVEEIAPLCVKINHIGRSS
jgi:hypothetical protein